jgi:predicted nucleic acid-binding protein
VAGDLRLLVDVDVVLDVLARRTPHYERSAEVWAAVETDRVGGVIAAHTVTTVHYLVARATDRRTAGAAVDDLLRVFGVAAVDGDVLRHALALGWSDFEDAVQMAAAVAVGATHLVTRNVADYRATLLPILRPAEVAALLLRASAPDDGAG